MRWTLIVVIAVCVLIMVVIWADSVQHIREASLP